VQHVKDGRAHIYMPLVGREEATRFEIRNLVGRFFQNSHELLLLNILEDKSIGADELGRVRQMLDESKQRTSGREEKERSSAKDLPVQQSRGQA
jgi:BlaI family transcriptional regulator, penicillinase repressor